MSYNIKFGYLNKEDILKGIETGKITPYSIVFSKDEKVQYVVKEDNTLFEVKSRVNVYDSVSQAIDYINVDTHTYEGQIVAIYDGSSKYDGYIVNKSDSGYYVSRLSNSGVIDYNELSNIPMTNVSGTVAEPVVLADLSDGTYLAKGVLSTPDGKNITSYVGNYVIVSTESDGKYITRISEQKLVKYYIGELISDVHEYVTDEYLKENGYIINSELNSKVSALGYVKQTEMEEYIEDKFENDFKQVIDEEIDDKMVYCSYDDITDLFK